MPGTSTFRALSHTIPWHRLGWWDPTGVTSNGNFWRLSILSLKFSQSYLCFENFLETRSFVNSSRLDVLFLHFAKAVSSASGPCQLRVYFAGVKSSDATDDFQATTIRLEIALQLPKKHPIPKPTAMPSGLSDFSKSCCIRA